jgi:hypothetical protein
MNSLYQSTVNYIYYFITRLRVLLNNTHKNVTEGEVNIDDHTYLQLEKLVLSDTFELEIGLMLLLVEFVWYCGSYYGCGLKKIVL